jgi:hypothetical protein
VDAKQVAGSVVDEGDFHAALSERTAARSWATVKFL